VQALLPFRHVLYPGNVSWTEEGHRFSWHMRLRTKRGELKVLVTDPAPGETRRVQLTDHLTPRQITKMSARPDMILQYVHFLRDRLEASGVRDPVIKVEARMSLNRRPFQLAVDPEVNLAAEPKRLISHAPWLLQLDESAVPGSLPRSARNVEPSD
jgi:vitamin K-dependent gamma-carboxylase